MIVKCKVLLRKKSFTNYFKNHFRKLYRSQIGFGTFLKLKMVQQKLLFLMKLKVLAIINGHFECHDF